MTTTQRRPRTKRPRPQRSIAVVEPMSVEVEVLTVRVTVGDEVTHYDVCPGTVAGRYPVWLWRKVLPSTWASCQQTPYVVDVGGEFGDSCTCKGNASHGHCKHADATKALIAAGKLADLHEPAAEPEPDDLSIPGGSA